MNGEHQTEIYKRWKKTNKNRTCKKNKDHYIDDWGCVDCMFKDVEKLINKLDEREEKNND